MQNYSSSNPRPTVGSSTYIIAEMACAHEGNMGLGKKIIDAAGRGGASAIQFQIWSLADMVVPQHSDYDKLAKIQLSRGEWSILASYARNQYPEMQIIACVYEGRSVDFAEEIELDAYKIHSSDLSNPYLVRHVAGTGKRIDLSVGASTLDEIQTAVGWIKSISSQEIWLMYGYQSFPTCTDDVHLNYMMKLRQLFEARVGYQDHSDAETGAAFWLPAAAVGMGVDILEKHITHDRSFKGVDHEAALNPDEFSVFVEMVREIESAKGVSTPKAFSKDELGYRKYSKKSIVVNHDLLAGSRVTEDDLRFLRGDELGLPPDQSCRLIGKKLKRDISAYHLIMEEDVA